MPSGFAVPPRPQAFLMAHFFMHWLPVGRAPTGAGIRRHCAATEPRSLMRDAAHRCNARAVVAALHLPAETRGFDARVYRPCSDRRADSSMHLDVPCSRRLGRREAPKRLSARAPECPSARVSVVTIGASSAEPWLCPPSLLSRSASARRRGKPLDTRERIAASGIDSRVSRGARMLTHRDLKNAIAKGMFRMDLFHRIAVTAASIPDLRERIEDLPSLIAYWLARLCERHGLPPRQFDDEAYARRLDCPWSGNVRELRNAIEGLVLLSDGPVITAEKQPAEIGEPASVPAHRAWVASGRRRAARMRRGRVHPPRARSPSRQSHGGGESARHREKHAVREGP